MTSDSIEKGQQLRKDSLEIVDLVEIIAGVLSIGIVAGIIIKVMKQWTGSHN